MNLEQRLQSAAAETNQVARNTVPRGFGAEPSTMRPWLAFAAAFAVVIAVVGIPWALGNLTQSQLPGDPLAGPNSSTTTVESDPATTAEPDVCVESGLYPPTTIAFSADGSDPRDTTEAVRDKLSRIAEAASTCDASALADLAAADISTTFGPGSGPEDIASWEADDERFDIIARLLNMSHGVTEMQDGSRLFVWPAAFQYDSWDDIPDAQIEELLRLYSQEELDQISLLGSYGGWRIGITETGEWIFFVAGD